MLCFQYIIDTFSEEDLKLLKIFKHSVTKEEIHFVLHVVNGIHIIIHDVDVVYSHVLKYD